MRKIISSLMTEKVHKVFVYGTLKKGEPNHIILASAANGYSQFLITAKSREKFPLVIGTRFNIPFLLDVRGVGHQVEGEVYQVDETMLAKLDELEDFPTFYDREIQTVITATSEPMDCWLYILREFPKKLLEKKHLESYHNLPEHPYCEKPERHGGQVKAIDDLAY